MSWNTIKLKVDLSSVAFPSGHDKLTEILVSARGTAPGGFTSHLSDRGLARLVELAFYGSQQSEEGRYPAYRFFCYPKADKADQLRTVGVFNPAIELDLATMRRLVHVAPRDRNALVVVEDGPRLMLTRIISIDSTREVDHLGRPEYWTSYQIPVGLMITVEGPGALQASEAGLTLKLRAGRIEEAVSVVNVPGVNDWFRIVATDLLERAEQARFGAKTYFVGNTYMLIASVWSQVLSGCVSQRHGGAFVIINPRTFDRKIRLNYGLEQADLGEDIVKFWLATIEAIDSGEKRDLELWLRRHNYFRKQVDIVSSLANVDGCVCLTPDLRVLGFGGEILVDETTATESPLVLVDARTDTPQISQDSSSFGGTRHRSAFRLCKKVSNVLAFVVSQDGDLSVFYSNDKNVYAFRSLGPWYTNAELE